MSSSIPVPRTLDDVTDDWLAAVLVNSLDNAKTAQISNVDKKGTENGLFSATVRAVGKVQFQNGEESEHRIFVKMMPPRKDFQSFISDANLDITEIETYKTLMADLIAFERKHLGADKAKLETYVPHGYTGDYTRSKTDGDHYYVMLEDLAPEFQNENISKGLSVDQVKAALKALAHYSAVAFCFKKKESVDFKARYPFLCEFFEKSVLQNQEMFDYIGDGMKKTSEVLIGTPEEELRPKVDFLAKSAQKTIHDLSLGDNTTFLVHGDSWSNNFLFNSAGDIKLIDWQFTATGNPLLDFGLASYVGLTPDVLDANWDALIQTYYGTFKDVCDTMKEKVPWTPAQFEKEARTDAVLVTLLWWGASFELTEKFENLVPRVRWAVRNAVKNIPERF